MNLLENFVSRIEQHSKTIGQVECSNEEAPKIMIGMMQSMGMANPLTVQSKSSKGVKISKKGNKYTLTLFMFTPPLSISWTGAIPMSKLMDIIEKLSEDKKTVGFMNIHNNVNSSLSVFQLALSS